MVSTIESRFVILARIITDNRNETNKKEKCNGPLQLVEKTMFKTNNMTNNLQAKTFGSFILSQHKAKIEKVL